MKKDDLLKKVDNEATVGTFDALQGYADALVQILQKKQPKPEGPQGGGGGMPPMPDDLPPMEIDPDLPVLSPDNQGGAGASMDFDDPEDLMKKQKQIDLGNTPSKEEDDDDDDDNDNGGNSGQSNNKKNKKDKKDDQSDGNNGGSDNGGDFEDEDDLDDLDDSNDRKPPKSRNGNDSDDLDDLDDFDDSDLDNLDGSDLDDLDDQDNNSNGKGKNQNKDDLDDLDDTDLDDLGDLDDLDDLDGNDDDGEFGGLDDDDSEDNSNGNQNQKGKNSDSKDSDDSEDSSGDSSSSSQSDSDSSSDSDQDSKEHQAGSDSDENSFELGNDQDKNKDNKSSKEKSGKNKSDKDNKSSDSKTNKDSQDKDGEKSNGKEKEDTPNDNSADDDTLELPSEKNETKAKDRLRRINRLQKHISKILESNKFDKKLDKSTKDRLKKDLEDLKDAENHVYEDSDKVEDILLQGINDLSQILNISISKDLEKRGSVVTALNNDPFANMEIDQEEKEIIKNNGAQKKSDSANAYQAVYTAAELKRDIEKLIGMQVEKYKLSIKSYRIMNRHAEDNNMIRKGHQDKRRLDDKKPYMRVYIDQSGSWHKADFDKARALCSGLKAYQDDGLLDLEYKYFDSTVYDTPKNEGSGGTSAWPEIYDQIRKSTFTNIMIVTDSDLQDYEKTSYPTLELEGAVFWVWKGGDSSDKLCKYLHGALWNKQYKLD